jgi:hypothetical protein
MSNDKRTLMKFKTDEKLVLIRTQLIQSIEVVANTVMMEVPSGTHIVKCKSPNSIIDFWHASLDSTFGTQVHSYFNVSRHIFVRGTNGDEMLIDGYDMAKDDSIAKEFMQKLDNSLAGDDLAKVVEELFVKFNGAPKKTGDNKKGKKKASHSNVPAGNGTDHKASGAKEESQDGGKRKESATAHQKGKSNPKVTKDDTAKTNAAEPESVGERKEGNDNKAAAVEAKANVKTGVPAPKVRKVVSNVAPVAKEDDLASAQKEFEASTKLHEQKLLEDEIIERSTVVTAPDEESTSNPPDGVEDTQVTAAN